MAQTTRISLIGLGALGILCATKLQAAADIELTCIVDAERQKIYAEEGVFCNGERCNLTMVEPGEKPAQPADILIVVVKGTTLQSAIADIANHVGPETIIISQLNGVTSEELLRQAYPQAKVVHCIAQGMDAVRVRHSLTCAQHGRLVLGTDKEELVPCVDKVARVLSSAGIVCQIDQDILHRLYAKWMMNVGINQVITLYQGTYRTIQEPGEARDMMIGAMREAIAVANAQGIPLTEQDLDEYVALSDSLSPDSMPSMRQDALAGRPTEVELFAGTVLAKGREKGIETPINAALYKAIKALG